MILQEFINKYIGKLVDFDGAFGAQCVDLIRQYFKDVWGLPKQPESVEGAEDFYFKHESRPVQRELCNCISYDVKTKPPIGSVVIFRAHPGNKSGHISICVNTYDYGMDVFEQDGIANDKAVNEGRSQEGAKITRWPYDRLVGWLTKKEAV